MNAGADCFDVVVVGAGFAGLCMGAKLKDAGIHNFVILEKEGQLGGTWRDNAYPGAACDVPGSLYSFSFMQEGDWSRRYPGRDELFAYTQRVALRLGLVPHLRLSTALVDGAYNDVRHLWMLQTSAGALCAKVLVCAVGPLSRPAVPCLEGLSQFRGTSFHSGRWNHQHNLSGRRVAVIGTGASAIQFIPEVAKQASVLHVFQRTPAWVVPRQDAPIGPFRRRLLRTSSVARNVNRLATFLAHEMRLVAFAKQPALMHLLQRRAVRHIQTQLPEALWPLVTPSHAMGCKRVLLSDDYYPALRRPNVELVAEPVTALTADAVVTPSGLQRPVDTVIFGTGFDSDSLVGPLDLLGRDRLSLQQSAQAGLEAYKGVTIAGFPNFFVLGGPNTGLGHTSLLLMIEASATYTVQALKAMSRHGLRSVEVKSSALRQYNDWLQRQLAGTVWSSGCRSWYLHSQSGRNHTLWPTFTWTYRRLTRQFDMSSYDVR